MMEHTRFPDLKDASVFITGGGSGIGAELTRGFLFQGAKVAFVQRRDGSAFCDEAEQDTGVRPLFIGCDVTNIADLREAIEQAARAHGDVGVVVNNAANDQRHNALEVDEAYWDQFRSINFKPYLMVGPVLFLASDASRAVAGQVLAADHGVVVTG